MTKLANGIRVATEEWPGETASVGVFINAGSGFETKENNGVAHFLEHMAFKGTTNRTKAQLETEAENLGAQFNAYTSREHTVYFAKSFKNDVPKTVEILGDILQNASFTKEAVESERHTILREAQEVENNSEEALFDYLHSAAFQGTSYGFPILGSQENIKSIKREDLIKYVKTYYTGPNMVVAAAGPIKHEDLCAQVEKAFGSIPNTEDPRIKAQRAQPVEFTGSEIRIRNDDHPLVQAAIAVEGVGWSDPDYYVLVLIQTMLGNWDRTVGGGQHLASRLCEEIATEGLAHQMTTFMTNYATTALFGNTFVTPSRRVDDLVYSILNEWQRIGNGATAKEVERAKNKLKANTLMQLDGTTPIMENIGRQMLTLGRHMSHGEVYQRLNDITVADVKRVAKTYLTDVSPAVVCMGPTEYFPDYNVTRGWTYWNRM